jgi:hypothetical protein
MWERVMKQRQLGQSGELVPEIGLGCMALSSWYNKIAEDDDGAIGTGLYSMLSFGDADPLADAVDPSNTGPGGSGASLAAGTYTIVVGGYNTAFGATIGSITAGAAAGAYSLDVTYVPAPGAVALMGLAGLVAGRRRR